MRVYEPGGDEERVWGLWEAALGERWPLSRSGLHETTVGSGATRPGDHFVAVTGSGEIVGFVATQLRPLPTPTADPPPGELMALLVDPAHRRQGIGSALLDRALTTLGERGATRVQLGSGGLSYFWPGVPTDLPDAWSFFARRGWLETWTAVDMVLSLDTYVTPPDVYARIRLPSIALTLAEPEDAPKLLAFEARHFPDWHTYYAATVAQGAYHDIVLATDTAGGEVVGAVLVEDFREPEERHSFRWSRLLGASTGGIGALGVGEAWRENGIGLALAARATEQLKARGLATAYCAYTWLADWYGKLGYRVWRAFTMSSLAL